MSGRQERRRKQRRIDRKARRLYAKAPLAQEPGEGLGAFQERILVWMAQTEARLLRDDPEDAGAILSRLAELNQVHGEELTREQNEVDQVRAAEVRMEDRPVVATPAAAAVLQNANVKAMLRRYEEMCRQAGQTVRGRVRVGDARIGVLRHPDNLYVNMWLWGEDPDDGHGAYFRTEETN